MDFNLSQDSDSLSSIFHKGEFKSVKHTHYFHIYELLFAQFRNKPITFLEVGVLSGGSLFMWREYFGKNARIIGIDLNSNAKKWEDHGFEIYIGDQEDVNFWRTFSEKIGAIDIVLDDGGHTYSQQIVTTHCLLGSIRDGGMLVVEDTHTSYMDGFGPKKYSFINYVKNKIDEINLRTSEINKRPKGKSNIFSVECFESMTVFKINRVLAQTESKIIVNQGFDDGAKDFRDSNSKWISNLQNIGKKIKSQEFRRLVISPYKKIHNSILFLRGLKLWIYF